MYPLYSLFKLQLRLHYYEDNNINNDNDNNNDKKKRRNIHRVEHQLLQSTFFIPLRVIKFNCLLFSTASTGRGPIWLGALTGRGD